MKALVYLKPSTIILIKVLSVLFLIYLLTTYLLGIAIHNEFEAMGYYVLYVYVMVIQTAFFLTYHKTRELEQTLRNY